VLLFVAIGLMIYGAVYYAAEQLLYRTGRSNPLFKIATASQPEFDWLILGASHAMPLDFADFNALMERETGRRILNLASPGTGPLYNRFVLENFLRQHRARGLLYVADSFAFYSRAWNEDRFGDAKLVRRTPFEWATARSLWHYTRNEGVDFRAVLDFVTGFSKINNRERFERDVWEGEAQFERVYRTSAAAVKKRIEYLYPDSTTAGVLARYLEEFHDLLTLARKHEMRVVVIKTPVPARYLSQLPGEAAFDEAISRLLVSQNVPFHDFSSTMNEPRFYFDTDHLNRTGLTEFFAQQLKPILVSLDRN
jgi:hypothetical protein